MITSQDLRVSKAFARLPDDERAAIAARSADVHLDEGEWLIHEGEVPSFFVLVAGRIAVSKSRGAGEERINTYRPGDFFGELPLLLNSPAVASLRALEPSRVARLDRDTFRELVVGSDALSGAVMRAMTERVGHLQQLGVDEAPPSVTVVGRRRDPACHGVRDFLARNGVAFSWLDPDDPEHARRLRALPGVDQRRLPVVRSGDEVLVRPDHRRLADAVGLHTTPAHGDYDVVVVGGGPAGLGASVYGASEGLRTLMVEQVAAGGQAGTSSRIENYLGFPAGLSGDDLSSRARQQAERFGAELVVGRRVTGLRASYDGRHGVVLDDGSELRAAAVVLATGVEWRRLGVEGVNELTGRGVYYGAARTEAQSVRGGQVHLIGGGNSAGQAAMLFSAYADRVTLLVRGPDLAASMSSYLTEQLRTRPNVSVRLRSEVVGCAGEDALRTLRVRDGSTGQTDDERSDGLFVFIGAVAETGWLPPEVARDERGFVRTGPEVRATGWPLHRDPMLLETSVPGVFAAGDVRAGSVKRVASGVGEGSMSIAQVHQRLAERATPP